MKVKADVKMEAEELPPSGDVQMQEEALIWDESPIGDVPSGGAVNSPKKDEQLTGGKPGAPGDEGEAPAATGPPEDRLEPGTSPNVGGGLAAAEFRHWLDLRSFLEKARSLGWWRLWL